jgi:hypothetical protein
VGKPRRRISEVETAILANLIEDGDLAAVAAMLGKVARHLEAARRALRKWDGTLDDKACLDFISVVWSQLDEPGTARDRFARRLLEKSGLSRAQVGRRLKVSAHVLSEMNRRAKKARR